MLDRIASELARLIAKDMYSALKGAPDALDKLKRAGLKSSGSGLPQSVIKAFEESFVRQMSHLVTDGYGKWSDGANEVSLSFCLTANLARNVAVINWAKAAGGTAEGVAQVAAVGGAATYNARIDAMVPTLVAVALASTTGQFVKAPSGSWRVLSPPADVNVAKRGTTTFTPHNVFFVASGSESDTGRAYKSAKKFLSDGWFRKRKQPIEGPYFG